MQDAVRGDHREIGKLLMKHGGKVLDRDGQLVDLSESHLSLNISLLGELEPDWEIDPKELKLVCKLGTQSIEFYKKHLGYFIECALVSRYGYEGLCCVLMTLTYWSCFIEDDWN